jgi:hypothetical protein
VIAQYSTASLILQVMDSMVVQPNVDTPFESRGCLILSMSRECSYSFQRAVNAARSLEMLAFMK